MASVGNINVNLTADISQFQSAMRKASDTIAKFSYTMNGKITDGLIDPLKKAKFEFKDIARIVGGIVISKMFYSGLNAIRNATDAVIDFRQELEYTQTAFANLFDDAALADELVNVLKDFSAVSPFDFESSAKAAQRLLAYGIKAKNVMYVMSGVLNAATMQGDPTKIEAISRALGQIYTKGTLKAEEVRQLAEAGIPAYEILAEKLNLSEEAMQNLGKAAIPANVAINALVDGINERFSGMAKASVRTMKGMISNIKDNALMLISDVFDPLYQQVRTLTWGVNNFFNDMYQLYELRGLGGVFEHLVPDEEDQAAFRQFIAILKEFGYILLDVGQNIGSIVVASLRRLVTIVNAIGPYFILAGQAIQLFVREVRNCAPVMKVLTTVLAAAAGAFMVFKAASLAAFILRPLTKVVMMCAKAFAVLAAMITAHPIILGLMLLGGAFAALANTSTKAGEAIRGFGEKLTKWLGVDPGTELLPDTKKRTAEVDKFNEALDTTGQKLDKTGDAAEDAAKKAKKAQKDLLSFDEVFRLNENKDETNGLDTDVPAWTMPELDFGDIGFDEPIFPDFADLWDNNFGSQLDKLKELGKGLWQKICDALGIEDPDTALFTTAMGAAIAAILAALLGASLWETLIAGLMGAVAGLLWEKIAEAFGMDEAQKHQAAICTAFGIAFGALCGWLLGLPVLGTVAAALGAGLAAEVWSGIADALGLTPDAKYGALIAAGIAAVIGAAFNNPIIGMVLKQLAPGLWKVLAAAFGGSNGAAALLNSGVTAALVGTWVAAIIQGIETGDWSGLIPAVLGTLGRILLGPIGGLGGLIAGYLYNATFESLKEKFGLSNMDRIKDLLVAAFEGLFAGVMGWMIPIITPLGTQIGNFAQMTLMNGLKAGIFGIITSILASALSNKLLEFMGEALNLTDQDIKNGKTGQQIGGICGSIIGGIVGFLLGGPAGAAIGSAIGNGIGQPLGAAIGALWNTYIYPALKDFLDALGTFFTDTLPNAMSNAWSGICTFFTSTLPAAFSSAWSTVSGAFASVVDGITKWFTATLPHAIGYGIGYVLGTLVKWHQQITIAVLKFLGNIVSAVNTFFTVTIPNAFMSFMAWFTSLPEKIDAALLSFFKTVLNGLDRIITAVHEYLTVTMPMMFATFLAWLIGLPAKVSEALNAFWAAVDAWVVSLPEKITAALGIIWTAITTWAAGIWATIQTIPEKLLQIGRDVIAGFLKGLQEAWASIVTAISEFVAGFVQGWKDALGIASPSTVFEEIGRWVIEGLLNGLTVAWELVKGWFATACQEFSAFFSGLASDIVNFVDLTKNSIKNFVTETKSSITSWANNTRSTLISWATTVQSRIFSWATATINRIASWASTTMAKLTSWISTTISKLSSWYSTTLSKMSSWRTEAISTFTSAMSTIKSKVYDAFEAVANTVRNKLGEAQSAVEGFVSSVGSLLDSIKSKIDGIVSAAKSAASTIASSFSGISWPGHASGGVFNKEHLARVSEGNKAEAIIPLEDKTAMQPFVDAVSAGLAQYLGPMMANMSNAIAGGGTSVNEAPPVYVGTLIADDRSLRELQRRMNVIQMKESRRST